MQMHDSYRKVISRILVLLFALLMLGASASFAYGEQISSYNLESYSAKIVVNEDNTYNYKETLIIDCTDMQNSKDVVFTKKFNGKYKGAISNVLVQGYEYTFNEEDNSLDVKVNDIGSNSTVALNISYTLTGVDYMGVGNDELYLPMIASTDGSVRKVSVSVKYPETMKIEQLNYVVGDEQTAESKYGSWMVDDDKNVIKFSGKDIPASTCVEIDATLPVGYWANATSIGLTKTLSIIILLAGSIILILLKVVFGKESKVEVSEEHYAPEGLSPAHVGYICDGIVDNPDITSMFYYMAEQGYMQIEEYERRKFQFKYIKAPKNDAKSVRILFDALFDRCSVGDVVKLAHRADAVKKANRKIKRTIPKDIFGGNRYFSASSKFANTLLWLTFAFVCAALPFLNIIYIRLSGGQVSKGIVISLAIAFGMSFIIERVNLAYYKMKRRMVTDGRQKLIIACVEYLVASVLFIHFFRFGYNGRIGDSSVMILTAFFLTIAPFMVIGMKARSKKNIYLTGRVMGLKKFMETASKEQIAEISSEDPGYYYKLLPYSLAFNIARKFAGAFEYVEVDGPTWYKPYGLDGTYKLDVVIMNSMITNLQSELSEIVYRPLDQLDSMVRR